MVQNKSPKITARGLVSPFGIGSNKLWDGFINNQTAIKENDDFRVFDHFPNIAARIPKNIYRSVPFLGLGHPAQNPLLFLIGLAIEDLVKQNNISISYLMGSDVALFVSTLKGNITRLENRHSPCKRQGSNGSSIFLSHTAETLASELKIQGSVRTISNACASGTVALALAADELRYGKCKKALIVGADLTTFFVQSGFASLKALSRKPCVPFGSNGKGLSLGEGAGVVLLELESDGKGHSILGSGITNDAYHITRPAENGSGLKRAIRACLIDSGVSQEEVGAIVAHGTGTRYNDQMEIMAFQSVFHQNMPPICGIKGAAGHSLGASGIIETIIAMEILENKYIPPIPGLMKSDHLQIPLNGGVLHSSIVLNTNSGFGGINAAVLIGNTDE